MSVIESAGPRGAGRASTQPETGEAARKSSLVRGLVILMRPRHAIKTILLVPVVLIDPRNWTLTTLGRVSYAGVIFLLTAACVYVGNDIADRHRDLHHPAKRQRPIASGQVPLAAGYLWCAVLAATVGVAIGAVRDTAQYWPVLVYLALNVAYSRGLKHVPLLDVYVVASGFVLRVVQGYLAAGDQFPGWLLVAVFAASLALLVGKRRRELLESGTAHRPALRGYSVEVADRFIQIAFVLAVVAGLIYLSTEAPLGNYAQTAMLVSVPFVLFVLFRYLKILLVDGRGSDPVRELLSDHALVATSVAWAAVFGATLLFAHHSMLAHPVLP
ncbi:MAG TPA: UbiA prenyltransferase family protein [Streptosporangiaceae bacterium]